MTAQGKSTTEMFVCHLYWSYLLKQTAGEGLPLHFCRQHGKQQRTPDSGSA